MATTGLLWAVHHDFLRYMSRIEDGQVAAVDGAQQLPDGGFRRTDPRPAWIPRGAAEAEHRVRHRVGQCRARGRGARRGAERAPGRHGARHRLPGSSGSRERAGARGAPPGDLLDLRRRRAAGLRAPVLPGAAGAGAVAGGPALCRVRTRRHSYHATYSRGGEILDETLRACGAQRLGEFGRHNAAAAIPPHDAARAWGQGAVEELTGVAPALG